MVYEDMSLISFVEGRFNDNDYVKVTYKNLTTGSSDLIFRNHLLIPDPGHVFALPIAPGDIVDITIESLDAGRYPPATIDIMYKGKIEIDNIYINTGETHTFQVWRPF